MKLEIPRQLKKLIELGIWPKTSEESMQQNSSNLISKEHLKKIAPDEEYIYFYPPPFETIQSELNDNKEFWIEFGAIHQLETDKCLIIGDFGLGSDAAIILDYSNSLRNPRVKRQVWASDGNYWETIAIDFEEFIEKTELGKL
jgi:hypothetical protein